MQDMRPPEPNERSIERTRDLVQSKRVRAIEPDVVPRVSTRRGDGQRPRVVVGRAHSPRRSRDDVGPVTCAGGHLQYVPTRKKSRDEFSEPLQVGLAFGDGIDIVVMRCTPLVVVGQNIAHGLRHDRPSYQSGMAARI